MARHEEIVEEMGEGTGSVTDKVIHVALGTNSEKERWNLLWVLKNFPGHMIVIVHVHRPSKWIPILGAKFLESSASKEHVTKHRKEEKKMMNELLNGYMRICHERKVEVRATVIVKEDIFVGIQDLVGQHQIKRLVMGSRFMSKKKVLHNRCQVWLVCNGKHISTSEAVLDHAERDAGHQEDQEPSAFSPVLDSDEYLHYMASRIELEDEIMDGDEEAQVSMQEAPENSGWHSMAKKDDVIATLLETNEVKELRRRLVKAAEEAHLAKERISALEQLVAQLHQENSEKEREIQALRTAPHCTEFSLEDIIRATNNFSASQKIGEGGYGPVFKGLLYHTPVAIKMLHPKSNQGRSEYQQEVFVLSKIRHPNIVILIGVCSGSSSLIYEYLQNGSVEERLARKKNNTPPLLWQERVRIISEQRSALIFLHSHSIMHCDLKLQNILLNNNNVSRLGDFGTARFIHQDGSVEATTSRQTTPMGTVGYMDPRFLTSGELTPECDVYSFGIVILRLLTGLPVLKIAEQVEEGLQMEALHQILDDTAGEWPVVRAEQLLRLALRCCHMERRSRPMLISEDWRTLEILRAMAGNQA